MPVDGHFEVDGRAGKGLKAAQQAGEESGVVRVAGLAVTLSLRRGGVPEVGSDAAVLTPGFGVAHHDEMRAGSGEGDVPSEAVAGHIPGLQFCVRPGEGMDRDYNHKGWLLYG